MRIERPILRYHGGKWRHAPWILSYFPRHRVYCEPYGGAASVLLQKRRSYAEIYNDLDSEVVNVFRVLRNLATASELERLIRLTPFSREDFEAAYEPSPEPLEQARRTILKSYAGFGSDSIHRGKEIGMRSRPSRWKAHTGFRSDSNRSGTTPAKDWMHYPEQIIRFVERLQGVVVENRPALQVIRQYDYPDTLHFIDPPYVRNSRRDRAHGYRHEMSDDDHRQLAEVLRGVRGMVILAGYPSELYDKELFSDWIRVENTFRTCGPIQGTEVLWFSSYVPAPQGQLFVEARA